MSSPSIYQPFITICPEIVRDWCYMTLKYRLHLCWTHLQGQRVFHDSCHICRSVYSIWQQGTLSVKNRSVKVACYRLYFLGLVTSIAPLISRIIRDGKWQKLRTQMTTQHPTVLRHTGPRSKSPDHTGVLPLGFRIDLLVNTSRMQPFENWSKRECLHV